MSLADDIIYGDAERVKGALSRGEDPNEVDEYGFTPLIEAAIVQKPDVTNVLLNAGADPNQTDMAGRTPLHWAAQNNNLELAKLLISAGANVNAHTYSAEPVLAMPLLRQQEELKSLLYKHGASLPFAKDYINAKLLGHRFELLGHSFIANPDKRFVLIDLEGFLLEVSLRIIEDSLRRYRRNYAAKQQAALFTHVKQINTSLEIASELIHYQQYTINVHDYEDRINTLISNPLLLIPATYAGHAITFVRYRKLFAKIDRGANSRFEGSVVIYEMTQPENLTPDLIKQILYQKQSDEFMHQGINQKLGLKRLLNLPIGPQITGNCSWANVEAAIPTMLFILLTIDAKLRVPDAIKHALAFYRAWREWDKDRALDECIQGFTKDNDVRNAAKAILLAAILFQTCEYSDLKNIQRAERIMPILRQEKYQPFLENYIKVYYQDRWSEAGENLFHLFDMISAPKGK